MKKFFAILLAMMLVLSMSAVAFATDTENPNEQFKNGTFNKTFKLTNADTTSPAADFTFNFVFDSATDTYAGFKAADAPNLGTTTVHFDRGAATTAGAVKKVEEYLTNVNWPGIGIYCYKVTEAAGSLAGVTYSTAAHYLYVTVTADAATGGYDVAYVHMSDSITSDKVAGFENEYSAGALNVTKTVEGNLGDKDKYFEFTIELDGVEGKTYENSYAITTASSADSAKTISVDGEAVKVYLKHGETIKIPNLPYGVTYTVTETDYTAEGYTTDKTGDTGSISGAAATAAFTNTKGTTVDTGISTDSLPYIVLLGVVLLLGAAMLIKRRAYND